MKHIYTSILKKLTLMMVSVLFIYLQMIPQETSQNTSINEKVLWANEPYGHYDMTKEVLSKRTATAKTFDKGSPDGALS